MSAEYILTAEAVDAALDRVLERYGPDTDYRDQDATTWEGGVTSCRYVVDGQPACIVGVVLVEEFGVEPRWLKQFNSTIVSAVPLYKQGLQLAPDARRLLASAQECQDDGEQWGDAVTIARVEVLGYVPS